MEILVTGANGFVGRWLVLALSKKGYRVGVCMRNASLRGDEFRDWMDSHGGVTKNLHFIEYDMSSEKNPWEGEGFSDVKAVYHTAALFKFGLTREQAHQTNVEGGLRMVRWAATLPSIERLILLGGYRLTSKEGRPLRERDSLTQKEEDALYKRHGAYEASKFMEYIALRSEAKRLKLPFTVVHPSTVIGDSQTGETHQFIGYAQTVKEIFQGQFPALLGNERIFLPLISVDYVAHFMTNLLEHPESLGQEYCLLDQQTPKFHDLLRQTASYLGVALPRMKLPLALAHMLPKAILGERKEALPFLTEDVYDTDNADALAEKMGLQKPSIHQALERWLSYLVASGFGDQLPKAPSAFASLGKHQLYLSGERKTPETVYLHGIPMDGELWKDVLQPKEASLCIDLPGLGRSSTPQSMDIEWMEELFSSIESRPLLVAHSLGCHYALMFAKKYPEKIRGVVLIAPFFLQKRAWWPLRYAWLGQWIFRLLDQKGMSARFLGDEKKKSEIILSAYSQLQRKQVAARTAQALAMASNKRQRKVLIRLLEEVRCPVALIVGEKDPLVQKSSFPTHTIPQAGHYPPLTHPQVVASLLQDPQLFTRHQEISLHSISRKSMIKNEHHLTVGADMPK